jgi:hypothetical protein
VHWTEPDCILNPDSELENLDESFYGMTQTRLGGFYLGFVNVIHQVANTMEVRLAFSRDGSRWEFLNNRQPWLTTSPGCWDRYMVNISNPPIPVGDELYVFYGGASNHHDIWMTGRYEHIDYPEVQDESLVNYGLGLAKLRKDGYVSLDAGSAREGIVITRGLWVGGKSLVVNADCRDGGSIAFEVTDAHENILPGCSRAACDVFRGDCTAHVVTWQGKAEIPVSGQIRLRIFMKNASLYSFTFQD